QDFYHEYEKKVHLVNAVEGRLGTSRQLKEDDFYKLFFEAESFSVGNTGLNTPRPWPPRVIRKRHTYEIVRPGEREEVVDLFKTAAGRTLFWGPADKPAGVPKTMGEVREEVLAAWKTYEATRSMEAKIKALTSALRQAEVEDRNFDAALAGAA